MKRICLFLRNDKENALLTEMLENDKEFEIVNDFNEKTTIIVNDSLTKLAIHLLNNWHIKENIEQILLVGGSDKYGDVTAVAEKNIYDDPESAQAVFLSNLPIVMFGLNVTRNVEHRSLLAYQYIKNPQDFISEECGVYVETKGNVTRGMTVTDLYSDKQFSDHNVLIIKEIIRP